MLVRDVLTKAEHTAFCRFSVSCGIWVGIIYRMRAVGRSIAAARRAMSSSGKAAFHASAALLLPKYFWRRLEISLFYIGQVPEKLKATNLERQILRHKALRAEAQKWRWFASQPSPSRSKPEATIQCPTDAASWKASWMVLASFGWKSIRKIRIAKWWQLDKGGRKFSLSKR